MANVSMPLQYRRLYDGPLDADTIFDTIDKAKNYASSATSYSGQIISVKVDNKWVPYIIDENKELNLISASGASSSLEWEEI